MLMLDWLDVESNVNKHQCYTISAESGGMNWFVCLQWNKHTEWESERGSETTEAQEYEEE